MSGTTFIQAASGGITFYDDLGSPHITALDAYMRQQQNLNMKQIQKQWVPIDEDIKPTHISNFLRTNPKLLLLE